MAGKTLRSFRTMRIISAVFICSSIFYVGAFAPAQTSRHSSTSLYSSALIVQNKGGGHGELGYQLAKKLSTNDKITSITILQDDACKDDTEPFQSYYADLPDVQIIKGPLNDETTAEVLQNMLGGDKFDYVWDNCSKGPVGAGKALCDAATGWDVKLYTYVSSAGMYQPGPEGPFPMPESMAVKESSGQNQLETYAVEKGLPLVSFRPQYIYGPKANKYDYIDWYFDRLVRELPLPIPGDGTQLVSLTNSEDVASLLMAPLGNEDAAKEQRFFNCGTDELLSYNDVAYICAEAAGVPKDEVMMEHYDHDLFGKAYFPFRMTNFYVSPDTAKEKLGWSGPTHSLKDDMGWYFENYKARGGPTKKMTLVLDWEITVGSKTSPLGFPGSIYDKYDPLVLHVD